MEQMENFFDNHTYSYDNCNYPKEVEHKKAFLLFALSFHLPITDSFPQSRVQIRVLI